MLQAVTGKDADRMIRRSVNKKCWNIKARVWEDFVLWTVPYTQEREEWLREKYGKPTVVAGPQSWGIGVHTISMGESAYVMMCLQLD